MTQNNQLKSDLDIFPCAMFHGSGAISAMDVYAIKDMLDYIIYNQNMAQLHSDIPCPGDELYTEIAEELFCNIGRALLDKEITIGNTIPHNYNRKLDTSKNKFLYKLIKQTKFIGESYQSSKFNHMQMYYDDLFPTNDKLNKELKLIDNPQRMKDDNLFY